MLISIWTDDSRLLTWKWTNGKHTISLIKGNKILKEYFYFNADHAQAAYDKLKDFAESIF